MNKNENLERHMCNDPRVFHKIQEMKNNDTSFTESGFLGIQPTYKQHEVRKIWFDAIALGMNEGLSMGTLEGQQLDLTINCEIPRHKEFLEKFHKLSKEYDCAIQFHPHIGMTIIDLKNE